MTAQTGFVRDLQDDPHDDALRAIFCDWLADQDDAGLLARRRLLQVQAELDRWVPDLERRTALQHEEHALLVEHSAAWLGDLAGFVRDPEFRSGLVDVTFDAAVFLSRKFTTIADALFDAAWVGRVRIEGARSQLPALLASPALGRVRQLDLGDFGLRDDDLAALLASAAAGRLVALNLAGNDLTERAAGRVATTALPRLRALDLRNNRVGPAGIPPLLGSPRLPGLRRVEAHGNPVPPATLLDALAFGLDRGGVAFHRGLPTRLVNSVGMELALVPAGVFMMGSPETEPDRGACEGPCHEVEVTQPFYLGTYPVTQRQYQAVVGNNPSHFSAENRGGPDHPVEMVTWGNASAFCERLSQLADEAPLGRVYRLPTEAEWEHACRAGTTTAFHFGDRAAPHQANFDGRYPYGGGRPGVYRGYTTPVGAFAPNGFGLYDLHGNVWEWCADYYDERYYARSARRDPPGPRSGTRVSARGGSYSSHGAICRAASRDYWYGPHYSRDNIGFRVALGVNPEGLSR